MNRDFAEMLAALSETGADFLVIGAHAVAVHARPRATGDLDIWIRSTPENAARVWNALVAFGAPLDELTRVARVDLGLRHRFRSRVSAAKVRGWSGWGVPERA